MAIIPLPVGDSSYHDVVTSRRCPEGKTTTKAHRALSEQHIRVRGDSEASHDQGVSFIDRKKPRDERA